MHILLSLTKSKALPHTDWFKNQERIIVTPVVGRVNSGQAALRKLAYSEAAGQTLA